MGNLLSALGGGGTRHYQSYENYDNNDYQQQYQQESQPKINVEVLRFINSFKIFRERYSNMQNARKMLVCNSFVIDVINDCTLTALFFKDDTILLYSILEEFNNEDKEKLHYPILKQYMEDLEIALVVYENK